MWPWTTKPVIRVNFSKLRCISYESWINKLSIDIWFVIWFVRIRQYLAELQLCENLLRRTRCSFLLGVKGKRESWARGTAFVKKGDPRAEMGKTHTLAMGAWAFSGHCRDRRRTHCVRPSHARDPCMSHTPGTTFATMHAEICSLGNLLSGLLFTRRMAAENPHCLGIFDGGEQSWSFFFLGFFFSASSRVSEEMILMIWWMVLWADLYRGRLCPFWQAKAPLVCAATQTWTNQASVQSKTGVFPICVFTQRERPFEREPDTCFLKPVTWKC